MKIKEAIGSGLQAVPIAALTWTGICVALEVSALGRTPRHDAKVHRHEEGLAAAEYARRVRAAPEGMEGVAVSTLMIGPMNGSRRLNHGLEPLD
jgi:hypothetical protein